jgi:hypothetical protein
MVRKARKQRAGSRGPKQQERGDNPPVTGNRRVAEQVRKILRTHYASKYRVQ